MVTLTVMACMWVNSMLFCAESVSTRKIVYISKNNHIEMLEPQEYRFVKDLHLETITKAIYNGKQSIDGEVMQGCKVSTVWETTDKSKLYSEFPCDFTAKLLEKH